jgi:hypothetical protein
VYIERKEQASIWWGNPLTLQSLPGEIIPKIKKNFIDVNIFSLMFFHDKNNPCTLKFKY